MPEASHGNQDLNGDGDTDDHVLFIYDFIADTVRNLGLAIDLYHVASEAHSVAFSVSEHDQGDVDLDGAGRRTTEFFTTTTLRPLPSRM